jgi:hypothetical protein
MGNVRLRGGAEQNVNQEAGCAALASSLNRYDHESGYVTQFHVCVDLWEVCAHIVVFPLLVVAEHSEAALGPLRLDWCPVPACGPAPPEGSFFTHLRFYVSTLLPVSPAFAGTTECGVHVSL